MRVSVREAASLLGTSEEQIYDWIEEGYLPACRIDDHYRFNRSELLEWATERKLTVSPELFRNIEGADRVPLVSETLRLGGIFYDISGDTRKDVLRIVVSRLSLNDPSERDMLLDLLVSRETLGSTGVGDGIAIPHVRNPIVLASDEPLLSLCFLQPPVDFHAPDGKPIHALFVLVCPTIHVHLQLLAKLAHLLRIPEFRETIRSMAPAGEILSAAERLERT
jgi:PTS system nitrogen regulatory IIA component